MDCPLDSSHIIHIQETGIIIGSIRKWFAGSAINLKRSISAIESKDCPVMEGILKLVIADEPIRPD